MEELKNKAEALTESVKEYVETYYKLSVLNITEKATNVASAALSGILILFLGLFILLFSGLALAVWLGELLDSRSLGYLIVALIFLLILVILFLLRKRIVFPGIKNAIIKKLYE
ncbi:MAG: phage holin family protein [Chitinophagaceae bacterium]|nr:phage holin family protein [Chitinophagaceae bacterium]